jgi:hypothetical protein
LLALAGATAAHAQVTPAAGYVPPDDTQSVKVGAVIYYDYTFQKSPKSIDAAGHLFSPNGFNDVRTYINVTGNISHRLSFRITPDISRETNTASSLSGSLEFRLKYGFAQFNLDDWTGKWKQTWVRLGIQQTPYIDFQEGIYRYRFQGTIFAEREGTGNGTSPSSGMPSADAGASFHTNLPNNYGDVHVALLNGEGYGKAEANNQKALQLRGTLRPFATAPSLVARGLRVTGFYDADHYVQDGERRRAIFNSTFEHRYFNAGFDYLDEKDQTLPTAALIHGRGWSFYVTPFFKEKGNGPELLIRYDRITPNVGVDATRERTIAGFAYWFPHPGGTATACLLLDFEQVKFTGSATVQKIILHGLINF